MKTLTTQELNAAGFDMFDGNSNEFFLNTILEQLPNESKILDNAAMAKPFDKRTYEMARDRVAAMKLLKVKLES